VDLHICTQRLFLGVSGGRHESQFPRKPHERTGGGGGEFGSALLFNAEGRPAVKVSGGLKTADTQGLKMHTETAPLARDKRNGIGLLTNRQPSVKSRKCS